MTVHKKAIKLAVFVLTGLLGLYVVIQNINPFGKVAAYSLATKGLSQLSPKDRVTQQDGVQKQTGDLIYFTTDFPTEFDEAKVTITFKNSTPNQQIHLGFKDEEKYHYQTKPIDNSSISVLGWSTIGANPVLYQKNKVYADTNEFLTTPPTDAIIGLLNFDRNNFTTESIRLNDYKPSDTLTVISSPLRGNTTMYVYLKDEPFRMWIKKQDLNWYKGPDPLTIKVYDSAGDLVYTQTQDDDGIADASKEVLPEKEIYVENPGPGQPEEGVYKIIFESQDLLIKEIKTNLHKIVFEGPLFAAGNSKVYKGAVENMEPLTLFSNALLLKALTLHNETTQSIRLNDRDFPLVKAHTTEVITPKIGEFTLTAPKSDVILKGIGYFAFTKEQFFLPTSYHFLNIEEPSDVQWADYIISNYKAPRIEGDWKVAEQTFDLAKAVPDKNKLSWLIKSPNLKESSGSVEIIEVTYTKKPMIKKLF